MSSQLFVPPVVKSQGFPGPGRRGSNSMLPENVFLHSFSCPERCILVVMLSVSVNPQTTSWPGYFPTDFTGVGDATDMESFNVSFQICLFCFLSTNFTNERLKSLPIFSCWKVFCCIKHWFICSSRLSESPKTETILSPLKYRSVFDSSVLCSCWIWMIRTTAHLWDYSRFHCM